MIRALLVEDEDLAAQRLQQLIGELTQNITIVGRSTSVEETTFFLKKHTIDLMFLDINLSDGYSLSIFEKGNFKTPPIIFTTAYSQYAIRAFEHNSISYLLKPIKKEALQQAVDKFFYLKQQSEEDKKPNYEQLIKDFFKPYKERFLVKVNQKLEAISTHNISYFYSEDKLTFVMLKSGRNLPIEFSLRQLEEQLNPSDFYRINRKYLIHHSSIKEMFYTSKSRIKIELQPKNKRDDQLNFVAIEKLGQFKKWLSK